MGSTGWSCECCGEMEPGCRRSWQTGQRNRSLVKACSASIASYEEKAPGPQTQTEEATLVQDFRPTSLAGGTTMRPGTAEKMPASTAERMPLDAVLGVFNTAQQ